MRASIAELRLIEGVHYRRDAWTEGFKKLGYDIGLQSRHVPKADDVLLLWNRYRSYEMRAREYEASGATVLITENAWLGPSKEDHWFALCIGHHNGPGSWRVGSLERWVNMGIDLKAWRKSGSHVLLLPQRGMGEDGVAQPSDWLQRTKNKLIVAGYDVRVHPHPGPRPHPPIEWGDPLCVVTWASGAALKALVEGIPVFYELPNWVGATAAVFGFDHLDRPFFGDRLPMFKDLAWAMWRAEEIATGEPLAWPALQVAIYVDGKFRAREHVCPNMAEGIRRVGDKPRLIYEEYRGVVDADVAVFYGFQPGLRRVMRDYVAAGKYAVHIDLGYWSRRHRGSRYGYHRFSINDHHPVSYFQRVKHPQDRADALRVKLEKWKNGGSYVLLCGMSEKAAGVVGFGYQAWERDAVKKIQRATQREILYRPKHVKGGRYQRIEGAKLMPPRSLLDVNGYPIIDIDLALREAFCVVSHHSNAGMDAIVAGVPCFQLDGIALPMGLADFSKIETPKTPTDDERRQWVNDVAYTQFNLEEMRAGIPWKHFRDEGLIC